MTGEWILLASAASAAAGFTIDRVIGPGRKIRRRLHGFLGDWEGEPERRTLDGARILEQRRPGIPERMSTVEGDVAEIKKLLNGGGISNQVAELHQQVSDHIENAGQTRGEILRDLADARRLVGEAVMVLTTNQQHIEDHVSELDRKVGGRLFELEEAERAHRAMLHEIGIEVSEPDSSED